MSGTYEDLKAWQGAMDLVDSIYRRTKTFPREEVYGLTSQLRRAATSVASNIAEGKGRDSDKELVQFLNHARGSIYEVQTQLLIAQRAGYLDVTDCAELRSQAAKVGRLINGLIKAFRPVPES